MELYHTGHVELLCHTKSRVVQLSGGAEGLGWGSKPMLLLTALAFWKEGEGAAEGQGTERSY